LVDAALSLKAEERRMLFEEAAGIGLYRSRKADAERRLEKTHRNLDRVEDILSELRPRLKSLQKQAHRAEQYNQVKADLRVMLQEWYGFHWARVQENLNAARDLEANQKAALEKARETQASFDRDLSENQAKVQSQRSRLNTWHRQLADHHTQKENISRDRAVADERIRSLEKRIQDLQTDLVHLEEQEKIARDQYQQASKELQAAQTNQEEFQQRRDEARQHLTDKQSQMTILEDEATGAKDALNAASNQRIRLQSQIADRTEQLERKQTRLSTADSQIKTAESNYNQIHQQYLDLKKEFDQAVAALKEVEEKLSDLQDDRTDGEKVRQNLFNELAEIKAQYSQWVAELNVLEQAEQKLTGYADGAKLLLTESRGGKLKGAVGTLSNFLEVPEDLERPIAAALGEYLDAVILERGQDSEQALALLLDQTTKGVLLPLDLLVTVDRPKVDQNISSLVGIAADLIVTPPKYRPVVELLLGRVLVLQNKDDLKRVLRDQPPGTKAVTMQGEVYHATGEIIAGNEGQSGVLARSRQRKSWQSKINESSEKINELEQSLTQVDEKLVEISQIEQDLKKDLAGTKENFETIDSAFREITIENNSAERQFSWEKTQRQNLVDEISRDENEIHHLRGELEKTDTDIHVAEERVTKLSGDLRGFSLDEEREQLAHWETQVAVAGRALEDVEQRLDEREKTSQEASKRVEENKLQGEEYTSQIASLREETKFLMDGETTIQNEITELRSLIEETDSTLSQDEAEQVELQSQEAQARRILNQAERSYAQADINLTRNREKLEAIQERIREDIGLVELEYKEEISGPTPLPFDGYVQKLPVVKTISKDLGTTIREQRAQLRRLGAINPEAQEEYQEVNHRHEFLSEQLADLRKAEADLKEVIAELDVLMERDFRKTFDAVAVEFRDIFVQLFDGGKGQLVLSDPDDLTGSGVDINVRLPGRRMQGLSLLSGGERSLVATALIFALLRISPTPFCVLDEVDAMLDESNVARYRKLIRELSSDTQFIIITHNRNTVEVADVIYGIIMAEDSSSQVLSLKLDEVDEVIES
jgi:chromosome segregation protein